MTVKGVIHLVRTHEERGGRAKAYDMGTRERDGAYTTKYVDKNVSFALT